MREESSTFRSAALQRLLEKRIVVLDGAMGTMIQAEGLSEADFRGQHLRDHARDLKGNNDILCLTRPDVVETNTFGANSVSQADYGTQSLSYEINLEAARIARRATDAFEGRHGRPAWVAGASPPNRDLSHRDGRRGSHLLRNL